MWIDVERFIALKIHMYDRYDNAIKRLQVGEVEQIKHIWMARSMTFMNLVSQRLTNLKLVANTFGVAIDPSFMTQRALTDQAFRERHLNNLRQQAK
jgi:hypothetical protein